jgi:hypothetical protein
MHVAERSGDWRGPRGAVDANGQTLMMTPRVADIPASQGVARRVAGFLRFMRGRVVSPDMLVEYVYGDRPNGPPKHAVLVIAMTVRSLRARGYPVGRGGSSLSGIVRRSIAWSPFEKLTPGSICHAPPLRPRLTRCAGPRSTISTGRSRNAASGGDREP